MNMPKVSKCDAGSCSYNRDGKCHALAITVGDAGHPRCDTYIQMPGRGGDMSAIAGVGACRVDICRFNQDLECTAAKIAVAMHSDCPDCATFRRA